MQPGFSGAFLGVFCEQKDDKPLTGLSYLQKNWTPMRGPILTTYRRFLFRSAEQLDEHPTNQAKHASPHAADRGFCAARVGCQRATA